MKTSRKLLALLVAALVAASAFGQFAGTSATSTPVAGSPATGGPASFSSITDTGLTAGQMVYTGTGGLLSSNTQFTYDGTSAVAIGSSITGGLQVYNTSDQTTNYERVETLWSGNQAFIRTAKGGTGTLRPIFLLTGTGPTTYLGVRPNGDAASGIFQFQGTTTAVAGNIGYFFSGVINTATSGANVGISLSPTYNQVSGTGANTDFLINRTQTAVGSGLQSLKDMQVNGTSWYWFGVGNAPTTGAFNSSSTVENAATFAPIINQSVTAGYTALKVNVTETTTGSGTKRLLDLQVGGTSKFNVDNNGSTSSASTASAAAFAAGNGAGATPSYNFTNGNTTGFYWANPGIGFSVAAASVGTWTATGLNVTGTVTQTGKTTTYNNVATAGMGVGVVVANPRQTAVTNTTATLATYTVPAADSTYRVSANVQVTAATTAAMTVVCTYTDETNTSRAQTIPFVQLAGTFLTSITNVTGTGPYEGATLQIRCKAGTTIVFTTAGTVTGITYNVEGLVIQGS